MSVLNSPLLLASVGGNSNPLFMSVEGGGVPYQREISTIIVNVTGENSALVARVPIFLNSYLT